MQNTDWQQACDQHPENASAIARTRLVNILGKDVSVRNYICAQDDGPYRPKPEKIKMQLSICPTSYCSGFCPFCIATGIKEKRWIDLVKLEQVLKELHEAELVRGVSITGGEPFSDLSVLNAVLDLVYGIFGTGMEVSINTNGYKIAQIADMPNLKYLEALHISRHHYDDKRNESLFGIPMPSKEELKEVLHSIPFPDVFVLNCMLMKDYIGTTEEAHRFLDFAIEMGAGKVSFITGTPINEFVVSQKIDYKKIIKRDDPSLLFTRGYRDFEFCHCQDGIYVSEKGQLMRFYGRETNAMGCSYTRGLVYGADNHLRCNYQGEIIR